MSGALKAATAICTYYFPYVSGEAPKGRNCLAHIFLSFYPLSDLVAYPIPPVMASPHCASSVIANRQLSCLVQ